MYLQMQYHKHMETPTNLGFPKGQTTSCWQSKIHKCKYKYRATNKLKGLPTLCSPLPILVLEKTQPFSESELLIMKTPEAVGPLQWPAVAKKSLVS